jgi:hypothetical protein
MEGWDGLRDFDPANLKDTQQGKIWTWLLYGVFDTRRADSFGILEAGDDWQPSWYPGEDPSRVCYAKGKILLSEKLLNV